MALEMRDDRILLTQPDTMVGYTHSPVGGPRETIAFR
jgi:hypothetical protein